MKKFKIEFRWAVYLTFIKILWFQFEKFMGWHTNHIDQLAANTYFIYPLTFLLYYFAIKDKKTNYYKNIMTWQQGLISGVILSVIVMALAPFSVSFCMKYISPYYFENLIMYMVTKGAKPENAKIIYNLNTYVLVEAFSALSFGIIFAAASSFIINNNSKK